MFWLLGQHKGGVFAFQPGMGPTPSALEGEVLSIGQPGKSLSIYFFKITIKIGEFCDDGR